MSPAGTVSVAARRLPLGVEVHYDLRAPGGSVRFGAGPMVALTLATAGGLPRASSRTLAEPGVTVRIAYRLALRRFDLAAGLAADVLFVADDLAIGGAGTVARTSFISLSPFVSAAVKIF
jgi:hypothetical protein